MKILLALNQRKSHKQQGGWVVLMIIFIIILVVVGAVIIYGVNHLAKLPPRELPPEDNQFMSPRIEQQESGR